MMGSSPGVSAVPPEPVPSEERAAAARATMDALAGSRDVFETFFESARIGLALADLTGRYVRVNGTYAAMLGQAPEDLIGVPVADVLGGGDLGSLDDLLAARTAAATFERQYVSADGDVSWLLHGLATVSSQDGDPSWFAVSAQDITERRRAEQELRDLTAALTERAVRDPLTGLANRTLLEERLRAALSRDRRSGDSTGVLFLDLDGFKDVNDTHGHAVGDAVLRAVASRLAGVVRPSDTVARMGGDEFVVLVESATAEVLDALEPRVHAAVAEPVTVGEIRLMVGVSIGRALSEGGQVEPQRLLTQADAQMYAAKRSSR